jgi:hypothetical protein
MQKLITRHEGEERHKTVVSLLLNFCWTADGVSASRYSFYLYTELWVTDRMGPTADMDTVAMKNIPFHRGK